MPSLALDGQRGSIPCAPKAMEFLFIGYNSLPRGMAGDGESKVVFL
jgi:hypothetical protein